jgi:hypothetical protein
MASFGDRFNASLAGRMGIMAESEVITRADVVSLASRREHAQ